MSNTENDSNVEAEESLLYSSRHGEVSVVKGLLDAIREKKLTLNINCKGRSKSNLGWTPLHLATYFGHIEVVNQLLDAGANTDEVNDLGDTALHKASFIGNVELVILLLTHKADVHLMNGEGRTAGDVAKTHDVRRLIEAAEKAERTDLERRLLTAAKEGRVDEIHELLSRSQPPHINCVDSQGNTCLHCAAYRGHARVAVLLLQNGIDTTVRNNTGQVAIDLAKDAEIREVLSVRPVQRFQRSATRFEGPLLKRSRFLGWRPVWTVLQRGVVLYYGSRAEAARGGRERARKYLDAASVAAPRAQPALLVLGFSDGDVHRLALPPRAAADADAAAARQAWIAALTEHISFSEHYLWGGAGAGAEAAREATEEEGRPLGGMADALGAAAAALGALDAQLAECAAIVAALDKAAAPTALHHSAHMRFQHACGTGSEALAALRHCAALVAQARDHDTATLRREMERNRVLEEALAALARTHHELEMSVAEELTKNKSKKKRSDHTASNDDFYDVYEDTDDDDTLVTAGLASPLGALSPWGSSPDLARRTPGGSPDMTAGPVSGARGSAESLRAALSAASSLGTLVSHGGHVYRNARTHLGRYTPSFYGSQWSL